MDNNNKLEVLENSAVQAHISMLQGIINRMAGNSANCKNWTVTLVAGICLIPTGLFFFLDCYYLALERMCIAAQNKFLDNIEKNCYVNDLYKIDKISGFRPQFRYIIKGIFSFSTIPFYLIVVFVVLFVRGNT